MKILYYECFAGISGDMNLGAMIDLGVPAEYLKNELQKLPVSGYEIIVESALKNGISGTKVTVQLEGDKHESHTHGHSHGEHSHGHHSHGSHTQESHSHGHGHGHHHHDDDRTFASISKMIQASSLNDKVKKDSIGIFEWVAKAEGKIHGKPPENVHFHEVGAVDSIVDIVGAAICMDYLNPDKIISSPVELGSGFVHCAHGKFPVPAPATMEILKDIPVIKGTVSKEATTPTGAAILKYFVNEFTDHPSLKLDKTSYGIGHKDFEVPNVLRVSIATDTNPGAYQTQQATVVECNLDDMPSEQLNFVMQLLFENNAHDVFYTPIVMKKGRPAIMLSVLCDASSLENIKDILFKNTSTIGLREYPVTKSILPREIKTLDTQYGTIQMKICTWDNNIKYKPEIDDCIQAAKEHNIPLNVVIDEVNKVYMESKGK